MARLSEDALTLLNRLQQTQQKKGVYVLIGEFVNLLGGDEGRARSAMHELIEYGFAVGTPSKNALALTGAGERYLFS
jgi:hypothetical protein